MTFVGWTQIALYCAVVLALVKPLGWYMTQVFTGGRTFLSPVLRPVRGGVPARLHDERQEQHWMAYTIATLLFHLGGWVILYAILRLQTVLPFNPAEQGPSPRTSPSTGPRASSPTRTGRTTAASRPCRISSRCSG